MNNTMIPVAASLALLLAGPLAAQPPMGGAAKGGVLGAEQRLERMTEQLELTAEQQQTIAALFEDQASQREQMRADFRARIDAVLTDEQRAKRDEQIAARIDRRVARMAERLDLSDDQQTQLKTLFTDSQGMGRSGRHGSMREQLASILTDEQLAQLPQPGAGKGADAQGNPGDKRAGCRR